MLILRHCISVKPKKLILINYYSMWPLPFPAKKCLTKWNFWKFFHLNDQFRPMKKAPHSHLLATEIRCSKFSVVLNWLYSLERKTGNARHFKIFENFAFSLFFKFSKTLSACTRKMILTGRIATRLKKTNFLKLFLHVILIVSH